MSIVEYNEIVKKVNSDSLERAIYNEIERYCKERGMEVFQLNYVKYNQMRNYLIKINKDGLVRKLESVDEPKKKKKFSIDRGIVCTLLFGGISLFIGFKFFSSFFFCIPLGIIILAWGLKDVIPYSSNYDSDYVQRYFRAQEDARINTRAYLNQAWLHSGEIKILNDKINGKK